MEKISKIGRYEILGELGEGAMATVYKAFDPKINRTLAIKLLRGERCEDEVYRYRFLREAKASGKLTHPNIVTVYDVGEVDGKPYIAMELLEGVPLDEVMNAGKSLSIQEAVILCIQLADAVDYAHSRGIVHRDIKPSNIVRSKERNGVKITDFGIAHMETSENAQKTRIGTILGTPQYMSPEQVLGEEIDGRTDLFSLGVILYQLLTGEKPFQADTLNSLYMQIINEDPIPIGKRVPQLPSALSRLVTKLLQKKPKKRFQTGLEVAQELRRILRDLQQQEQEQGKRRIIPISVKWSVAMASIVTLTMIIGLTLVYSQQYKSLTHLALDYGGSLAKFISFESAEAILIEDWVAIETFVKETQQRQNFRYLAIVDHLGLIRGSTNLDSVGKRYQMPANSTLIAEEEGTQIFDQRLPNSEQVYFFVTPVHFQGKQIGNVYMAVSQAPLKKVGDLAILLMVILMLVTVGAVVAMAYLLAHRLASPIRTLSKSFDEIARGNHEYRIDGNRNDEFGQLYDGFNSMANTLQVPAAIEQDITRVESRPSVSELKPIAQASHTQDSVAHVGPDQLKRDELDLTRVAPPSNHEKN